ncbi:amino acid adenylation domain-containing protein [Fibrella sp. WM1]|uniref:amino acid adenylation domain-containing protein n=1 Tax=Fibrella musci TaxID=3242485 RepID=UPI003522156F
MVSEKQSTELSVAPGFALTAGQQALLFIQQRYPRHGAYNEGFALRIAATLSAGQLTTALQRLMDRHPALGTVFQIEAGNWSQRMAAAQRNWHFIEAAQWTDGQLLAHLNAAHNEPYRLETDGAFRAIAYQRPTETVLLLGVHHIIGDGWSMSLLLTDLLQLLTTPDALAPNPVTYLDFQRDQYKTQQSERGMQAQAYWETQLTNLPSLDLPTDRPAHNEQPGRAAQVVCNVPADVYRQLGQFAPALGISKMAVLLGTYQLALHVFTGQDDVVVGFPVANRLQRRFANLVGYVTNPLLNRSLYVPGDTVSTYLQQQHTQLTRALIQQAFPLADTQAQSRYQTFFSYLRPDADSVAEQLLLNPGQGYTVGTLPIETIALIRHHTQFPLAFDCLETTGQLTCRVTYDANQFEQTTIESLLGTFIQLLTQVVAQPESPLAQLDLLSPDEQTAMLAMSSGPGRTYPTDRLFGDLFTQQARQTPDAIAVRCGDRELTYQQLDRLTDQLASFLHHQAGIGAGQVVGLLLDRSEWLLVGLIGILKAGGTYLPIDPELPETRIAWLAEQTQFLLTDTNNYTLPATVRSLALTNTADWQTGPPMTGTLTTALPDDVAYQIYTSGSTGTPKGVMVQHKGLINHLFSRIDAFALTADSRVVQSASHSFDISIWQSLAALLAGGTTLVYPRSLVLQPNQFLAQLAIDRATVLQVVPTYLAELLHHLPKLADTLDFSALTWVATIGEELAYGLAERCLNQWPQAQLVNTYGPTEAADTVSQAYITALPASRRIPIGQPIPNTSLYVLTAAGQLCPVGAKGELYIAGMGVGPGYRNAPDQTAAAFVSNPFSRLFPRMYRTGDLARWLPDGTLEFHGRADHQVKIRGHRIELGEIEQVLQRLDAVNQAAVVVRTNAQGEKILCAYVVATTDAVEPDQIRQHLRDQLPAYMVPSVVELLAHMPLTTSGKIDRKALPTPSTLNLSNSNRRVLPQNDTEARLLSIWQDVLRQTDIGLDDDFFALGGHSINALAVVARLRDAFDRQAELADLYQYPTIAQLAQCLLQNQLAETLSLLPTPRTGRYPVTEAQRKLWLACQATTNAQLYNMPGFYKLTGPLDSLALQQAFGWVVARHESMRTVFSFDGTTLWQHLQPASEQFIIDDIVAQNQAAFEAQLASTAFDLATGPLYRVGLWRETDQCHWLGIVLHHTIADGGSANVLWNDLAHAYNAFYQQQTPSKAPLAIQYSDVAVWLNDTRNQAREADNLHYWQTRFADEVPQLALSVRQPRTTEATQPGRRVSLALDSALTTAIRQLAANQHVSVFTVLGAALNALFYKYTGQTDIVIGAPVSTRTQVELLDQVGLYQRVVPLRTTFSDNHTIADLIASFSDTVANAVQHQHISYELLVSELRQQGRLAGHDLFDVVVSYEVQTPGDITTLHNLTVTAHEPDHTLSAKYALDLFFTEQPDQIVYTCVYNEAQFDDWYIEQLNRHLLRLLNHLTGTEQSTTRLADLSVLSAADVTWLSQTVNANTEPYDLTIDYPTRFAEQVQQTPDAIAVRCEGRTLTYQQLDRLTDQLATYLMAEVSPGPGQVIGVLTRRTENLIISWLAVLKTGGAFLMLAKTLPTDRLQFMVQDADCRAIITDELLNPALDLNVPVMLMADAPKQTTPMQSIGTDTNRQAYVIYTSGSTGKPKGVGISMRSLVNFTLNLNKHTLDGNRYPAVLLSPVAFDGSLISMLGTLLRGDDITLYPDELTVDNMLKAAFATDSVARMTFLTPSHVALLPHLSISQTQMACVVLGGEQVKAEHVDMLRQLNPAMEIRVIYGPTETTIGCSIERVADTYPPRLPIGTPDANCRLFVLDRQQQLVPMGVPGELYIGGAQVGLGYLNRPELNRERFVQLPHLDGGMCYRTGDNVRWTPDGKLLFMGRNDEQIKLFGQRLEPAEIEYQLTQLDTITQAFVTLYQAETRPMLVAYLQTDQPNRWTEADAKAALRQTLPAYMVPTRLVFLSAFPLTINGKIDKRQLPAPVLDVTPATDQTDAELMTKEQLLLQACADVLGRPVTLNDEFFLVGGDSIGAIQIISRLKAAGYRLTVQALFEGSTLRRIAQAIDPEQASAALLSAVGDAPLSPIQRHFFTTATAKPEHFCQTVLLKTADRLDTARLENALNALLDQHDALRMTYQPATDGQWQQNCPAAGVRITVDTYSFEEHIAPWQGIDRVVNHLVAAFDLGTGPLMKAVVFRLADADYLFWAIHHLVVDGVSWRILTDQLANLYGNSGYSLPAKTASYRQWTTELAQYTHTAAFASDRAYWQALADQQKRTSDPVKAAQAGWYDATRQLSIEATQTLLTSAKSQYGAGVDSLLLTALQLALPADDLFQRGIVDMERHGRDALTAVGGADVSGTVGWFTQLFPVVLPASVSVDLGQQVTVVAEAVSAAAQHATGFLALRQTDPSLVTLQAPVLVNYLGQLDQPTQTSWTAIDAYTQTYQHDADAFPYALVVNGAVLNGQLRLQCLANRDVLAPADADQLADRLTAAFEQLLAGVVAKTDSTETATEWPLSPGQQRMWFIDQYEKETVSAYNLPHAVTLRGQLNRSVFEQALGQLVARHDALRTNICMKGPQPVQVVTPADSFALPFAWLDVRLAENPWEAACQLANEEARRPFKLATDSLVQVRLIQFDVDAYLLVNVIHHIMADGWSLQLLYQELMTVYNALLANRVPVLPALTSTYGQFARWQQQYLQTDACLADRAYWKAQLAGELVPLQLPTDAPRPRYKTYNSQNLDWVVNEAVSTQVNHYRQQTKSSLFSTLFAAIGVLLHRYSNQEDLVIGTPVTYREQPGLQQQVGLFLNTLPIRLNTSETDSFTQVHQQVRRRLLEGYEHQLYPLEQIVDDVQASRDMSRSPLFDVMIASEDFRLASDTGERTFEGLTAVPHPMTFSANKFDLSFYLKETDGQLVISIGYNTDLFGQDRIERMARHLETILDRLTDAPDAPIASFDYLTYAEYKALVIDFNQTEVPYPTGQTLHQMVEESVAKHTDRVALRLFDKTLTYGQLNQQANQLAHHLIESGLPSGANVGLIAERDFGMIVGMLAILKAGGAYVPIDPTYPADRQAYILQNAAVTTLVTDRPAEAPAVEQPLTIVPLTESAYVTYPASNPNRPKSAQDLAYIIHTSGSSGRPKGVMIEHHSAVNLVRWVNCYANISAADKLLFVTSMCFDLSVYDIFGMLAAGGELVITPTDTLLKPSLLADYLQQTGVTFWDSVPTTFYQLLTYLEANAPSYQQLALRTVFLSGDWIPVSIPGQLPPFFPNARLTSLGGATEGTVWSNFYPVMAPNPNWVSIPYGKPLDNNFFYILDAQLNPVPEGVVGDLYIGGVGVAAGYVNDVAKTEAAFMPDPFNQQLGGRMYRTGDLGRMMPDGNMEFLGRKDQQVKIKGYRIEIGEIETVLSQHPQVREVAVLAKADPAGQKQLVAFVAAHQAVDAGELGTFLRQTLPAYMIPAQFVSIDTLPLNTNGKIDRKALAERRIDEVLADTAYVAPQTTHQQQLAELLESIIGTPQLGIQTNLFTVGLDSLKAVQVYDRIQHTFGKTIEIRELFSQPTIAELALLLEQTPASGAETAQTPADIVLEF